MKTILFLDSCVKGRCTTSRRWVKGNNFNPVRLKQHIYGYTSIFKHINFFKENNIDILLVDNSVSSIDELPEELRNLIPKSVRIIVGNNNKYGQISKGAGVIEHWRMGQEIWKDYDYIIHFELRQILVDLSFFHTFLNDPISIFCWCAGKTLKQSHNSPLGKFKQKDIRFDLEAYGKDNSNIYDKKNFNDFYTGLFSCHIKEFIKWVDGISLDQIIYRHPGLGMMALEKMVMCFAYYNLPEFKLIAQLNVRRCPKSNSIYYNEIW